MRILIQHRSRYSYATPAALGPHTLRLRPAGHTRATIETYRLSVGDDVDHRLHWQQDPQGNHIARATWKRGHRTEVFEVVVELAVDLQPINPFDFFVDDVARDVPFVYADSLQVELAPFLAVSGTTSGDDAYTVGPHAQAFLDELPTSGNTVTLIGELNQRVAARVSYVIRNEAGVWTPEETITNGRGSCRDSAVLLIAALRSRGLAARFVSGYLVQLVDEGMLPDEPRGVARDVVDLHAWAEVYLPGAGWIGLDATSGLLCGEGHIPLACTATPATAAPVEGTCDTPTNDVAFETYIIRLGHEARPTAPYTDDTWRDLLAASDVADAVLTDRQLTLTVGGEPTFTSRLEPALPEWNGAALGDSKTRRGRALADELRKRLSPGAAIMLRQGKHYPGESLPRWGLELIARRDGIAVWPDRELRTPGARATERSDDAKLFLQQLAHELGVAPELHAAFEDPWWVVRDESVLPPSVDPMTERTGDVADIASSDERRRLARVLDRGPRTTVAWVLPLARQTDSLAWSTERWKLRRDELFLLPGDSPAGLRLPLGSLDPGMAPPMWADSPVAVDPRYDEADEQTTAETTPPQKVPPPPKAISAGIRTALCVEPRDGELFVFVPPLARFAEFLELIAAIDRTRVSTGIACRLEGYPPPPSPDAFRFAVTPDPGVLEINAAPMATGRAAATQFEQLFDAALATGLSAEKYLLDGRMAGSGGGNHITLGGPTPLQSPFLQRPDILASVITFVQHHPSLSYLFTGLFIGPTSQAPRLDEARHDTLYELELALERAFAQPPPPPWMCDALFRHFLIDVAGSTHRAEISIDKLFDGGTPFGRQGLLEFRAFEMPPHPRMAAAQTVLLRAIIAAVAVKPYKFPLVRWGQELHDRFLLPYWLERDLHDVLTFLAERGVALPQAAFVPFSELRCPLIGVAQFGDVTVELRNALEPWHVLGEEVTRAGTSRFVDSSMERIEIRVRGLARDRHVVAVNGARVPLRPTVTPDEWVGGVRFRAWAPPHSLQPHLGIHHPLHVEVVDTWAERSLGGCTYHVWHPEGRAFDEPPLTRIEASARRAQRFAITGGSPWPVRVIATTPHPDQPHTLDLRRLAMDHPLPLANDWTEP